jgi:hypothetical protein
VLTCKRWGIYGWAESVVGLMSRWQGAQSGLGNFGEGIRGCVASGGRGDRGRWKIGAEREEEDDGFGEKRVKEKIMQWYLSLCTLIKRVVLRLACIQVSSEQASWKSSRPRMAGVPRALCMQVCMGTSWTGEGRQTKKKANEAKGTLVI